MLAIMTTSLMTIILPVQAVTITDVLNKDDEPLTADDHDQGSEIHVSGGEATAGVECMLYWDAVKVWDGQKGLLNSTEAHADSTYEIWFEVPEAVAGDHWLWVKDTDSGDTTSQLFEVAPKTSCPDRGLHEDRVEMKGYGFDEEVRVCVMLIAGTTPNGVDVVGETIGTGDGEEDEFDADLDKTPVEPGSVTVTDGTETFTDNGRGDLVGSLGGSGEVDYVSGDIKVEFDTAPVNAQDITCNYKYFHNVDDTTYIFSKGVETNDLGSWSKKVTIPKDTEMDFGQYNIYAYDDSGNLDWDDFKIGSGIALVTKRRLSVSLVEPDDSDTVDCPVTLKARVRDRDGSPLDGATVTFYVDDSSIGSNTSNSSGYAVMTYTGREGGHDWYVVASKSGYRTYNTLAWSFNCISKLVLEVSSAHGSISGGGSYIGGSEASFSVSPTNLSDAGIRYIFIGWTSDSPGGYNGTDNPALVVMNNDITEVAQWETRYFLTVEVGAGGSATPGSGWYDPGSAVTIIAKPDTGYMFHSWSGDGSGSYSGTESSYIITVDEPTTQTASFEPIPIYTLTVQSQQGNVSGEGSYQVGSRVLFGVTPTTVFGESGVRYIFTGWTSSSPGGYTGPDNSAEVVMNNEIIETALWKKQYLLTIDSVIDVEGSGWYNEEETVTLSVKPPPGFLVRQVFKGWTGDIQSDSGTVSIVMDGPKMVVANWTMDYTRLYLLGGMASVVAASVVVLLIQRRRIEKRQA